MKPSQSLPMKCLVVIALVNLSLVGVGLAKNEKPETPARGNAQPEATPNKPDDTGKPDNPGKSADTPNGKPPVEVPVGPGVGNPPEGAPAANGLVNRPTVQDLIERAKEAIKKGGAELPADVKAKKEALEAQRQQVRDALKAQIEALGANPTKREVNEVVAAFKEKNKEALEDLKDQEKELKEAIKDQVNGNVPDVVKAAHDAVRDAQQERRAAHDAFKKALKEADSAEEKRALVEKFREDQKIRHEELKAEIKKLREEARGGDHAGGRRLED